jgi:hypothetical protein
VGLLRELNSTAETHFVVPPTGNWDRLGVVADDFRVSTVFDLNPKIAHYFIVLRIGYHQVGLGFRKKEVLSTTWEL